MKISTASVAVLGLSGIGFFGSGCGKGEARKVIPVILGKETPLICPFCAVGCGMIGVFREKKLHSIEGNPAHPINRGALCAKGQASIEFHATDRRILTPLKRGNPRKGLTENPQWKPITWERAFREIARKTAQLAREHSPERKNGSRYYRGRRSPLGFMGSAAITSEAAYQYRKLALLLGSSNIECQARKCHSSTVAALGGIFGFGAMTNHFGDLENSACILILGSNCAETHPIAWRWIKRAQEAGAGVIHVDPRFTRTSARADLHLPIRAGSDLALIHFLISYAIRNHYQKDRFIREQTDIQKRFWRKYRDEAGRMSVETACSLTGIAPAGLERLAEMFCKASSGEVREKKIPAQASVIYALGLTQHLNGVEIIQSLAFLQTILGNMGRPGGGINALRGHSNVQGSTDLGLLSDSLPGYVGIPQNPDDLRVFQDWKNQGGPDSSRWKASPWYPENHRSAADSHRKKLACYKFDGWRRLEQACGLFAGTSPGKDPEKEPVICDLPLGDGYRSVELLKAAGTGKIKGMFVVGENPAVSNPDVQGVYKNLARLELLVAVDLFETETAHFADYLLPAASFLEEEGSKTNSGRWVQWSYRAVGARGKSKPALEIMNGLYAALVEAGAIRLPSSTEKARWNTRPEMVYREISRAVKLYSGMSGPDGKNLSRRKGGQRRTGLDAESDRRFRLYKDWGWSWPDNVRILYHAGETGETLIPTGLTAAFPGGHTFWLGKYFQRRKSGYSYDRQLLSEGRARFSDQPVPRHAEPRETPDKELSELYPARQKPKAENLAAPGDPRFPYILTTYAVAEHFGGQTRQLVLLGSLVPDLFLEIGRHLAGALKIKTGQTVKIVTLRGEVKAKALVTDRLLPLTINGKLVHQVGLPYHWGFKGIVTGDSANRLVSDLTAPETGIPESKALVCNVIPIS
ncbi:MAG: molybdopterin oxidoreductase family protein [bacterium]